MAEALNSLADGIAVFLVMYGWMFGLAAIIAACRFSRHPNPEDSQ